MPTTLQKVAIGEELLASVCLLKTGLRELNRMKGGNDFYHLPIQLLASGFERMMKVTICCHHLETKGSFPKRSIFPKGNRGHDLVHLLKQITKDCFSEGYLSQIPAARTDIEFLRSNSELSSIVQILSDFGMSARYYNLNVVLEAKNPGSSPDDEWRKLKLEVFQQDPSWASRIADPNEMDAIHTQVNKVLTIECEKFARALGRLYTLGCLGEQAKQISCPLHHFRSLMDDNLGETDYENIDI